MIKLLNILKEVMEQEEQSNTAENTYDKVIKYDNVIKDTL